MHIHIDSRLNSVRTRLITWQGYVVGHLSICKCPHIKVYWSYVIVFCLVHICTVFSFIQIARLRIRRVFMNFKMNGSTYSLYSEYNATYVVDCGEPNVPVNGTVAVSNDTTYGAEVYFACDTGFRLEGNASSVCQLSGQWEPGTPICQIVGNYSFRRWLLSPCIYVVSKFILRWIKSNISQCYVVSIPVSWLYIATTN